MLLYLIKSGADRETVESKYWPSLDGLRGACIIAVLASHLNIPYSGGFIGVNMFFVLSGFLITSKLLSRWSDTGQLAYGAFFLGRIKRLLPALLAMLVLSWLLWYQIAPRWRFFPSVIPVLLYYGNWTGVRFIVPLSPTWSLCIEEQFYLIWPFFLGGLLQALRSTAGAARVTLISAGCLAITKGALYFAGSSLAASDSTLACADALLIGGGFALLGKERQGSFWGGRRGTLIANACFITLVVFSFLLKADSDVLGLGGSTLIALYALATISHCVHAPAGVLSQALNTRWLTELGRRSYGLYLYHMPVFLAVAYFLPKSWPFWLVLIVKLACSLAVCCLSYRFIEMPFLRKGSSGKPTTSSTGIPGFLPNSGAPAD